MFTSKDQPVDVLILDTYDRVLYPFWNSQNPQTTSSIISHISLRLLALMNVSQLINPLAVLHTFGISEFLQNFLQLILDIFTLTLSSYSLRHGHYGSVLVYHFPVRWTRNLNFWQKIWHKIVAAHLLALKR